MPPTNLPHRDSYYNFSRFAPTIIAALRAYPNTVIVDPQELSVETYAQRLRDAANAAIRFGHKFPSLDAEDLLVKWPKIKVSMRALPGQIVIGSTEAIRNFSNNPVGLTQGANEIVFSATTEEALRLLCQLLSMRSMQPCPIFLVNGYSNDAYRRIEEECDVIIEPHPSRAGWMQIL